MSKLLKTTRWMKKTLPPGSVIEMTKKGHIRVVLPNGKKIHTGGTPSDPRSLKNFKALVRKQGYEMDDSLP